MIKNVTVLYRDRSDLIQLQQQQGNFEPDNVLLQIFSGILDQKIILNLLSEIKEIFPGTAVIGTSTAGEIINGETTEKQIVISLTQFQHSAVASTLIVQNDDLIEAGREIAHTLKSEHVKGFILFGCGLKNGRTINGEPLLSSLQKNIGKETVIAGGQAGDNGEGKTTFVFTQDGLTENGIAAAALSGEKLRINRAYNLSWVPIGKKFTITKAEGPRVYSIDNRTPYDLYCHYLGQEVADNLPLAAADFPMIIERGGTIMAIHATGVNNDGSFEYIHDFHAGEQIRFGFCHAGLLAIGAELTFEEVKTFTPEVLFIYSCVSRKWVLGTDISVELSSVVDLAPSAGFFCYGEYYTLPSGQPFFFSQTMTILSLSEKDEPAGKTIFPDRGFSLKNKESRQFRTMRVLHRLVETSAREIESMNAELAKLVRKDSLTGLANRRRFDEEFHKAMKRHKRSGSPCRSSFSISIFSSNTTIFTDTCRETTVCGE